MRSVIHRLLIKHHGATRIHQKKLKRFTIKGVSKHNVPHFIRCTSPPDQND